MEPPARQTSPLLSGPILPTLVRMSLPNMVAMVATALVAIAETRYVGVLGTPALAGMALVFPMVMLQQMMSAGAMGGGISSAISRALGAGNEARARALAVHAALIGLGMATAFILFFLLLGPSIYRLLGGQGEALAQAVAYSTVVFAGAFAVWSCNTLASIVRGGGNMILPSATLLAVAATQIAFGGALGLGFGPVPRLGISGVAAGQVIAYAGGAVFLFWFLRTGRARVPLSLRGVRIEGRMFHEILRVGALACMSPLQAILTAMVMTRLVAYYGTEALAGYGIGMRLEFLLIPIVFGVGVASVPMVGMAIGAGNVTRARQVAWTAAAMAGSALASVGLIFIVAPELWVRVFSEEPLVQAAGQSYLRLSGPGYGFFGFGMCLYFASQGAGKMLGPVLVSTLRLAVVAVGGLVLTTIGAPQWTIFALAGLAMVAYGTAMGATVYRVKWGA